MRTLQYSRHTGLFCRAALLMLISCWQQLAQYTNICASHPKVTDSIPIIVPCSIPGILQGTILFKAYPTLLPSGAAHILLAARQLDCDRSGNQGRIQLFHPAWANTVQYNANFKEYTKLLYKYNTIQCCVFNVSGNQGRIQLFHGGQIQYNTMQTYKKI